ncbi:MAG TPA: DUF2141 domain-containing protein [Rhizomicrobium sp.]|nr:DUF2141 domain-containing protein [Rhizomicrobium sp.]
MKLALAFAALLLAAATASAAPPQALGVLTVKVEKVSPMGGDVRVALYNEQNYAVNDADPVIDAVVPAHTGETIVVLKPLKPGFYAVKMFQDFNRNGKFDMNWLGLPIEKYGFSNDARPTFSEPPFDATKFELKPGANTITITLQ